jgi:prolyl oligopeptidase
MRGVVVLTALLCACSAHPTRTPSGSGVGVPPRASASSATVSSAAATATGPGYPASRVGPDSDLLHGERVADPYRWLEDAKSPEVQLWMGAQDQLARARLRALPERDAIAARLKELMYVDQIFAPVQRGGRYFFSRRRAAEEKAVVYWKKGKKGAEHVLLDPNGWSSDGSVSLTGWEPSWSGKLVAFRKSENNSDEATMAVMEVDTGKVREIDTIAGAKYAMASWTPKDEGFYYTWLPTPSPAIPSSERPGYATVRFHQLGTDPAQDPVLHDKTGDPSKFLGAYVSRDGRWLLLRVDHGWTASDAYVMDLRAPAAKRSWKPLATGGKWHYSVQAYGGRFYVHTDEAAPNWRVLRVDPARPAREQWQEVVAERADATLSEVSVLGGKLALHYLKDAASQLEIRELDGELVRQLPLPTIGTVTGPTGRDDDDEAFFAFESFTVPPEVYSTSIASGKTTLRARVQVPIDPTAYSVEQAFLRSKDGTRISMFLVVPKGFRRDGQGRALLSGYGGFQVAETPIFRASIYPWIERGGVFALANLRGGGEYGESWHRAGMRLQKQHTFDDFIAAAEYLIAEKVTRPERLAIRGASNGGLLLGAVITQRPELFAAALCGVPLLDMVRYHQFGSGKTWISEYGSADDPELFRTLVGYSPYHHVRAGTKYPSLLLLSADSDDRVDPMHARKFAAAMQAASAGGPVLLRIERKAGHAGADLIKATVEKTADEYAFALAETAPR